MVIESCHLPHHTVCELGDETSSSRVHVRKLLREGAVKAVPFSMSSQYTQCGSPVTDLTGKFLHYDLQTVIVTFSKELPLREFPGISEYA